MVLASGNRLQKSYTIYSKGQLQQSFNFCPDEQVSPRSMTRYMLFAAIQLWRIKLYRSSIPVSVIQVTDCCHSLSNRSSTV